MLSALMSQLAFTASQTNMQLFAFFLLCGLITAGFAWESTVLRHQDPAHPGKCVTDDLILSPGEHGTVKGQCLFVMCHNEEGGATHQGCGVTGVRPPCKVGDAKYPDEPYPKCCEKEIICPEGVTPTEKWETG